MRTRQQVMAVQFTKLQIGLQTVAQMKSEKLHALTMQTRIPARDTAGENIFLKASAFSEFLEYQSIGLFTA